MKIQCKICKSGFEWERNGRGGRQPTICLRSKCRKMRDHLCYEKWKKKHTFTRYEKNKEKKQPEYITKNTPKPTVERRCQFPGCKRLTARGGINFYYCQQHWELKQESVSQEYGEYIGSFEDIDTATARAF